MNAQWMRRVQDPEPRRSYHTMLPRQRGLSAEGTFPERKSVYKASLEAFRERVVVRVDVGEGRIALSS